MNNKFWLKYLAQITGRLQSIALLIMFFYHLLGIPYLAKSFTGSWLDIILLVTGTSVTIFIAICPSANIFERQSVYNINEVKKDYVKELLINAQLISIMQAVSGGIVLFGQLCTNTDYDYGIAAEIYGLIGFVILLFCPSADTINEI